MNSNRINRLYKQYETWTDAKLQRHILAHPDPSDIQSTLALSLALLAHRMPFYGKSKAILESPEELANQVAETCERVSDDDRTAVVLIICSIAQDLIERALEPDSRPIEILVVSSARICNQFQDKHLSLCSALHAISHTLGKPFTLDDAESVVRASMPARLDNTEQNKNKLRLQSFMDFIKEKMFRMI